MIDVDAIRFDALTRSLGRRGLLRSSLVLTGFGSAVLLAIDETAAAARPVCDDLPKKAKCRNDDECCSERCRKKKGRKKGKCRCSRLQGRCTKDTDCCGHDPADETSPICGIVEGNLEETECCVPDGSTCFRNGFC
jgi:hypothetical protein